MQIALACHEAFDRGGIRPYIKELSNRFASAGHRVFLFAPTPPKGFQTGIDSRVVLEEIPRSELPFSSMLGFALRLPSRLRQVETLEGPFDIVHSNTYADAFLRKTATRGMRLATVHHLGSSVAHSMALSAFARLAHPAREYGPGVVLEGWCIQRADHLVAVSQFTKADIMRQYPGIDPSRISVIHLGSTLRNATVTARRLEQLKLDWGRGDNAPLLLYVGRLEERKGTSLLLNALALLNRTTQMRLLLIGAGDISTYEKLGRKLGISEKVTFAGYVDDETLGAAYRLASVLVHPASMEGFGLTIADAVDIGLPVVATRVGSIPEIVREGVDGFLSEYGDPRSLAKSIQQGLEMAASAKREKGGEKARRFSWERTALETLSLYERLVSMRSAGDSGHYKGGRPR